MVPVKPKWLNAVLGAAVPAVSVSVCVAGVIAAAVMVTVVVAVPAVAPVPVIVYTCCASADDGVPLITPVEVLKAMPVGKLGDIA